MTLKIAGRVLTASAAERTITGLLLPFGEEGHTSAGRVTCSAGAVTVPEDTANIVLNIEHDGTRPVGRASQLTETEQGLTATFTVAKTRAGDDVLEEASEGLRASLSVEVESPVIRSGALIGGDLSGAAVVVRPAFPSAQLVASDYGVIEEATTDREATYTAPDGTETTVHEHTETTYTSETTEGDEPDDQEEDSDMGDSTATATVQAGSLAASRTTKKGTSKSDLFTMLASGQANPRALEAALSDIVPGDILGLEQPQYVGELWDGKAYERRIIPLFNHSTLTSFAIKGWRWVTKPEVAAYSGNKTAVPSNAVETEQVEISASRIAGAHDIDRKFRDFNDAEFFAAYFAAMTESYARVSDATALADIVAAATPVERGTVPTDVPAGLVSVVDGALSVLNETDTAPTFAVVATDLWRDILLTPKDKTLEYLSSGLGLESGSMSGFRLLPSAAIGAGEVLVGVSSAATVHELGATPIRVEALDIANGGVDQGVFGYIATNVHDDGGLALVTAPTGV